MSRARKVAVYAEHCLRAGEIVSRRDLDERPDSDDFVWIDASTAANWAGQPAYSFLGRAGRNALDLFGVSQ